MQSNSGLANVFSKLIPRHTMVNFGILIIIFSALALIFYILSYHSLEKIDKSSSKNEAIYMAKNVNNVVHEEYLNNYALDKFTKAENLKPMAKKYVLKKWQQNMEYVSEFGYECERQGFKRFLISKNLFCEKLTASPLYNYQKDAYEVKCESKYVYDMRFDYDKKEWNLKQKKFILSMIRKTRIKRGSPITFPHSFLLRASNY